MSTDTQELKAGRELDALVAEKVFGKEIEWIGGDPFCGYADPMIGGRWAAPINRYSTDIAAAWEVVEKFRGEGLLVELTLGVGAYCRIRALRESWETAESDAPLAICLAALKAVSGSPTE